METTQILDTPATQKPAVEYAGKGARFANYIIDIIGFYVLTFLVAFVAASLAPGSFDPDSALFSYGLSFLVYFIYFTVFESSFGKTPGKFITRTHVVTEDGERPTTKNIMGRTLCRMIPFEPFSFLGSYTGWHDTISKTLVVKDNPKS